MSGPARWHVRALRPLVVVLVVVGVVMAVLWALQRQLIYFPDMGRSHRRGRSSRARGTSR